MPLFKCKDRKGWGKPRWKVGFMSLKAIPSIDGLDPDIAPYVMMLRDEGVETFESCDGGPGHAYAEPTVRFHGNRAEGFRALAVAQTRGTPVSELRRVWPLIDDEPTGPYWELTFYLP